MWRVSSNTPAQQKRVFFTLSPLTKTIFSAILHTKKGDFMKNEQKSCAKIIDQQKQSRLSRILAKLDDNAYDAYSLLKDEIEHHGILNSMELSQYLVTLQNLEKRFRLLSCEYDVEYHNVIIPMVRAFRQEQEKLEQKYNQNKIQIMRHTVPALQINRIQADQNREMAKLKERQAATKRAAIDKMSAELNACKHDIQQTLIRALMRIYQ